MPFLSSSLNSPYLRSAALMYGTPISLIQQSAARSSDFAADIQRSSLKANSGTVALVNPPFEVSLAEIAVIFGLMISGLASRLESC